MGAVGRWWQRIRRGLSRAQSVHRRRPRSHAQRAVTLLVCALAGFMIVASGLAARGTDLRASRNTELIDLVVNQAEANRTQSRRLSDLRAEVDALGRQVGGDPALERQLGTAAAQAGLTAVKGPAVSVTLTDAPPEVNPPGVDPDVLVVHQQDIQAVVNTLWQAGAEAMTIQGVRVNSRTGVKCVGNTVVLHGIPYAPPYRIVAIGNTARLQRALATSEAVSVYKQYVAAYRLGYVEEVLSEVTMPAFVGAVTNRYARTP